MPLSDAVNLLETDRSSRVYGLVTPRYEEDSRRGNSEEGKTFAES